MSSAADQDHAPEAADGSPGPGEVFQDLACVFLNFLVAKGVAYPLGVDVSAYLACGIQVFVWLPSAVAQNERFYDFTGMLSFIAVATYSQLSALRRFYDLDDGWKDVGSQAIQSPRPLIATVLVLVWTTRLGTFLFQRILKDGHDSRFDNVRDRPFKFLLFWCVQGMWVFFTPLAMLALHTLDPTVRDIGTLGPREVIGLAVWILGFSMEVVADRQKSAFKADSANAGKFIDVGLWSRCRHPNYVGEMTLWVGFFVFCSRGVLYGAGWLTVTGPIFVVALFAFVSTPLIEKGADKKYGGQVAYQEYKRRTPCMTFRLS